MPGVTDFGLLSHEWQELNDLGHHCCLWGSTFAAIGIMSRYGTWIQALGYRIVAILIYCYLLFSSSSFFFNITQEGRRDTVMERDRLLCAGHSPSAFNRWSWVRAKTRMREQGFQHGHSLSWNTPVKPSLESLRVCNGRKLHWGHGAGFCVQILWWGNRHLEHQDKLPSLR